MYDSPGYDSPVDSSLQEEHGAVSYRILDTGVPFSVLSNGQVLLAAGLDHDAIPSYIISIQAYDGGADPAEPGAIRTATVRRP